MLRHYRSKSMDQYDMLLPESNWVAPTELPDLSQCFEVAIDTETKDNCLTAGYGPGFFKKAGYILGISVAFSNQAMYFPMRHEGTQNFDLETMRRWLKQLISQSHTRFIFHNFAYDWGWIQATFNLKPPDLLDDTGAMASMIDENQFSFSLDSLCKWQGIEGKDEQLLRTAANCYNIPKTEHDLKANLWRMAAKYVGIYAEADARQTLTLARKLRPILADEGLDHAYQIERDLMPLTLRMKQRGIRVDANKAEKLAKKLDLQCQDAMLNMSRELGTSVGIAEIRSNRWLEKQFTQLHLDIVRTAPTDKFQNGQASFEHTFMATHSHWFPQAVQRIKHQTDLAEKFLRGYICEYVHNGRIHATVNQFRSETGGARSHRFSYADPPLQQMPSRDDEYAPLIRSCFLPEEGDLWCSIDWRQQEYRLIVFVAELLKARGAKAAADMYRNDPTTDFHNYVAQITRLPRRRAKDVNFAKSYGAGVYKFSLMTGLDQIESKTVMDQYDERLPFVKEASDRYSRFAQDFGYIKLIDGARNHFNLWEAAYRDATAEAVYRINHPNSMYKGTGNRAMYATTSPCSREEAEMRTNDSDHPWRRERLKRAFTHKAFNRMIQGSAARQMKKAMVDIARAGYEPLIQLHDELGFSFADERDGVACAKLMEEACPIITIPMLTDTEWGETWGTAKETYVQAAEKKYFF